MTKKILLGLVIVLALAFLTGLSAYACGNNGNSGAKTHCPIAMKGVEVEATNIANGVVLRITSDDPEVVKQIQERKPNCSCSGMKDVKCEVTNMVNGVTITITSEDPEVVKQIQEHRANCLKNGHKEGSEECLKAHESGKCSGHQPGDTH